MLPETPTFTFASDRHAPEVLFWSMMVGQGSGIQVFSDAVAEVYADAWQIHESPTFHVCGLAADDLKGASQSSVVISQKGFGMVRVCPHGSPMHLAEKYRDRTN